MPPRIEHRIVDDVEYKICKGVLCKEDGGTWKSLTEFGTDSKSWDKLKSLCKECKNSSQRKNYSGESVKEIKSEPEPTRIGRPIENSPFEIEDLLLDYDLYVLDDIEETDQPSRVKIHYTCSFGHDSTTRFDTIKTYIDEYKLNERYNVCIECNKESKEIKQLIENENIVEEKGFVLSKMYKNERNDFIYDILCKNNHLTEGRMKSSFIRSFTCKECIHNTNEYICSTCQQLLPLNKFNKCETNDHRNKTDHHCKKCREKQRNKRKENGYKLPTRQKLIENGIEGKLCCTEDCGFHPYSEYWKDIYNEDEYNNYCKKCRDQINKKYSENNKEKIKEISKNYQKNNRERIRSSRKEWIKNNKEKYRESNRNYSKKRRDIDPNYKLLGNLRHRIYLALINGTKSQSTLKLIGCTIDELWNHFEYKFQEGMTKENYGSIWHVDHYVPCNAFNLNNEKEQRRCFNWRNLQPMFASENISKGDRYTFDIVKEIELYVAITED
jgi:hypothetical protein